MSEAKASIIRPTGKVAMLVALVPMGVMMLGCAIALRSDDTGIIVGLAIFIFYRILVVRLFICRDHHIGVVASVQGRFEDALKAFERSEAFWARHETLDRFRALLLGSATSHPFQILAIYNQGYCLSRLKRGSEARAQLERVLAKAPDMGPARELRDVLDAGASP